MPTNNNLSSLCLQEKPRPINPYDYVQFWVRTGWVWGESDLEEILILNIGNIEMKVSLKGARVIIARLTEKLKFFEELAAIRDEDEEEDEDTEDVDVPCLAEHLDEGACKSLKLVNAT